MSDTVSIPAGVWKDMLVKVDTLVQQGIRDHADWRSKLNFLEADYKAEVARLSAENEVLRKKVDWLQKADRLVIWNGTEWQVRHQLDAETRVAK